jgi:hypothetical protein
MITAVVFHGPPAGGLRRSQNPLGTLVQVNGEWAMVNRRSHVIDHFPLTINHKCSERTSE